MAVDTLPGRHGVPACQREPHRGVVELRVQPVVRQVARSTIGGEMRGDVVGIRAPLEICGVTGIALRGHRLKLTLSRAFVAGVACHGRVGSCQRKAVIVLLDLLNRNLPSADRVALLAIRSQLPLVNVRVTVLASLSDAAEYHLDVTLDAAYRLVHAAQRISRLVVIEFRDRADRLPPRRGVAVLTRQVQIPVRAACDRGILRLRLSGNSGNR